MMTTQEQLANNFDLHIRRMWDTTNPQWRQQNEVEAFAVDNRYRELTGESLFDKRDLTVCKACNEIITKPNVVCSTSCYRDAFMR